VFETPERCREIQGIVAIPSSSSNHARKSGARNGGVRPIRLRRD
jgi:hypothetical protein